MAHRQTLWAISILYLFCWYKFVDEFVHLEHFPIGGLFSQKKTTKKKNPSLNLVITYCSPVSEEGTRKGRGRCVLVTAMYFNMRQQQC